MEEDVCREFTKAEKQAVREEMRRRRRSISPWQKREWDRRITENFLDSDLFRQADCVYCYCATDQEIDTGKIMQSVLGAGKRLACPRVSGKEMNFYFVRSLDDCLPGFAGIREPRQGCGQAFDKNSLVILPGLAFSKKGGRIGAGGGYYDRFLLAEPGHKTVALAYAFQVFASLPAEETDCPAGWLVTPEGVFAADL